MAGRIIFSFFLLISILFWPFWLSVLLALGGMAYFKTYWEAAALLLLSDLLFGASEARFGYFVFVSLSLAVLCLMFIEALKKKMRLSPTIQK